MAHHLSDMVLIFPPSWGLPAAVTVLKSLCLSRDWDWKENPRQGEPPALAPQLLTKLPCVPDSVLRVVQAEILPSPGLRFQLGAPDSTLNTSIMEVPCSNT